MDVVTRLLALLFFVQLLASDSTYRAFAKIAATQTDTCGFIVLQGRME